MLVKAQVFRGDKGVFDVRRQFFKADERAVLAALEGGDHIVVAVVDHAGLCNGSDTVQIQLLPGGNVKNKVTGCKRQRRADQKDEKQIAENMFFLFAFQCFEGLLIFPILDFLPFFLFAPHKMHPFRTILCPEKKKSA